MPRFSQIETVPVFQTILQNNPNIIIIKLEAAWCGPCQRIKPQINRFFEHIQTYSPTTPCYTIDIDANPKFASFLKTKRVLSGVPMLLCYKQGNTSAYPDESCIGADPAQITEFINVCIGLLQK